MTAAVEVRARREWLVELRAARDEGDQPRVADLLTEIAVQAPELQGAACEVVRGNNDAAADQREEWARGFFSAATQSRVETTTVTPAATPEPAVVPAPMVLRRFERKLGETKPAVNEVGEALQAAIAKLPKEEPEAEREGEAEPKSGMALAVPSNELLVPVAPPEAIKTLNNLTPSAERASSVAWRLLKPMAWLGC